MMRGKYHNFDRRNWIIEVYKHTFHPLYLFAKTTKLSFIFNHLNFISHNILVYLTTTKASKRGRGKVQKARLSIVIYIVSENHKSYGNMLFCRFQDAYQREPPAVATELPTQ
jgi:hypothetical protein